MGVIFNFNAVCILNFLNLNTLHASHVGGYLLDVHPGEQSALAGHRGPQELLICKYSSGGAPL
jgi:hypothetical protein